MKQHIKKGMYVRIKSVDDIGQIVEIHRTKTEATLILKTNALIRTSIADLEIIREAEYQHIDAAHRRVIKPYKRDVPYEIDLHGMRVEEALRITDKFVDDALVSNYSYIRIVHGHGTGRLLRALHDYLDEHKHVKNYRLGMPVEGGNAVTVVEFK